MSEENISLSVNSPAPSFELIDIFDRPVSLKDYRKKKVLLAFFRHAGCPFCNVRVPYTTKASRRVEVEELTYDFLF